MKPTHLIGIDPGVDTGVAVYDAAARRLALVRTLDFWRTLELLDAYDRERTLVVIEAPHGAFVYRRFAHKRERGGAERQAQNVGQNRREAQLLIEGVRRKGFEVREVKPVASKWDAGTFERITGWKAQSSQHGRDAARLVFGF